MNAGLVCFFAGVTKSNQEPQNHYGRHRHLFHFVSSVLQDRLEFFIYHVSGSKFRLRSKANSHLVIRASAEGLMP